MNNTNHRAQVSDLLDEWTNNPICTGLTRTSAKWIVKRWSQPQRDSNTARHLTPR